MERLYYAAAPLSANKGALQPDDAEALVVTAAEFGEDWLGARSELDLERVVEVATDRCIAPSDDAFGRYVGDRRAENYDRARVQENMLEEHYRTQRSKLEAVLERHRSLDRGRLVAATEGRLRALDARVDRRGKEIAERETLRFSNETVCVGVIEVSGVAAQERDGARE